VRDDALQEEVLILTKENNKLRTHIGMLQSDVAYYEAKLAAYAKAVDSFKVQSRPCCTVNIHARNSYS
jgi:hypothetical protein